MAFRNPLGDVTAFAEVVADVIEPLVPGFAAGGGELVDFTTETTPVGALIVAAYMPLVTLFRDPFLFRDIVRTPEVLGEDFLPVEEFGAGFFDAAVVVDNFEELGAAPGVGLVVLGVFVALPVVLAAKGFGASFKGTAVEAFVAFLMFSVMESA